MYIYPFFKVLDNNDIFGSEILPTVILAAKIPSFHFENAVISKP